MGLRSFIKKQFIDAIEWDWQDDDVLMWKFPMADNEIQSGASLTVRDGQVAVFINEGQIADVFTAGRYELTTETLPVMTNLRNWRMGFDSPFKSDVLFFSTRLQQGRKWGTTQPVTVRDSDFGMVRLRAFGMYSYKINDVTQFYQTITGMNDSYRAEQIEPQLRNLIVSDLASGLGQSQIPFIDLAANQGLMADEVKKALQPDFAKYGLSVESFVVENVSLPEELQKTEATLDLYAEENPSNYYMLLCRELNYYTVFAFDFYLYLAEGLQLYFLSGICSSQCDSGTPFV